MIDWATSPPFRALLHWFVLAPTISLIGLEALLYFVVMPDLPRTKSISEVFERWSVFCLIILALATGFELLLRTYCACCGTVPFMAAISRLVTRTHFGRVSVARWGLLLALFVFCRTGRARRFAIPLILAFCVGVTLVLVGHAADQGDLTIRVLVNGIHVIASSVWVGGLAGLALLGLADRRVRNPDILSRLAPRFSVMAGACLAAVIVSGIFNAYVQMPNVSALWQSSYGRVLSLKIGLVGILVGLGAINRFAIVPYLISGSPPTGILIRLFGRFRQALLGHSTPRAGTAGSTFFKWLWCEALMGALILAVTALLTQTMPARHAAMVQGSMPDCPMVN